MLIKESITSQKLGSWDFWWIAIVFSAKVNLLYLLYSTAQKCCLLHLIKENCLLKTFLKTLILMTCISYYLFSSSVTPKMDKKFITNLDSSKAPGPICIPVVVLKNCQPKLSYILAKLFNICLRGCLVFQPVGRSHWWSLYLRMLGKGLQLKNTTFFL